jgi:hypothetical protein
MVNVAHMCALLSHVSFLGALASCGRTLRPNVVEAKILGEFARLLKCVPFGTGLAL